MSDLISRADAMGAVQEHFDDDGFKGYSDGQKMMDRINALPSAETHEIRTETHGVCSDLISRADAIEAVKQRLYQSAMNNMSTIMTADKIFADIADNRIELWLNEVPSADAVDVAHDIPEYCRWSQTYTNMVQSAMADTKSADAVQGAWIPCNEKMPKELERVNVTWLNHNPPFYYQHIKDIPQTDTAVYYRGKWYWWDATVIDILAEYGENCNAEQIDKDIEVVAWMPLPTPYKGGDDE